MPITNEEWNDFKALSVDLRSEYGMVYDLLQGASYDIEKKLRTMIEEATAKGKLNSAEELACDPEDDSLNLRQLDWIENKFWKVIIFQIEKG